MITDVENWLAAPAAPEGPRREQRVPEILQWGEVDEDGNIPMPAHMGATWAPVVSVRNAHAAHYYGWRTVREVVGLDGQTYHAITRPVR